MLRLALFAWVALFHYFLYTPPSLTQGIITTVVGSTWVFTVDGGPATVAPLGEFQGVAVDSVGNVFAADVDNNLVVKISPSGVLTVVAGNGTTGFSGNGGPATSAQLWSPEDVAVDAAGNLFIADTRNGRIRQVSPDGIITTFPATDVLSFPRGSAVDTAGSIYVASASSVIQVSPVGNITHVAGIGEFAFSGDDGLATSASLSIPKGVAVDAVGNLYIADTRHHRIRKVSPSGTITPVAGNGVKGFSGDGGPATCASLNFPEDLDPDSFFTSETFGLALFGRQGRDTGFPAVTPFNETARQLQFLLRIEF